MALINLVGVKALRQRLGRLKLKDMAEPVYVSLVEVWEQAASEFIDAALEDILVQTGMSAASFFPLARVVRNGDVSQILSFINSRATSGPRPGIPTFPDGRRTRTGFQDIDSGDRLGERAYRLSFGSSERPVFIFTFQTVVWQHAYYEPEQQTLEKGRVAFVEYVNNNFANRADIVLSEVLRGRSVRRILGQAGIRRLLFGAGI